MFSHVLFPALAVLCRCAAWQAADLGGAALEASAPAPEGSDDHPGALRRAALVRRVQEAGPEAAGPAPEEPGESLLQQALPPEDLWTLPGTDPWAHPWAKHPAAPKVQASLGVQDRPLAEFRYLKPAGFCSGNVKISGKDRDAPRYLTVNSFDYGPKALATASWDAEVQPVMLVAAGKADTSDCSGQSIYSICLHGGDECLRAGDPSYDKSCTTRCPVVWEVADPSPMKGTAPDAFLWNIRELRPGVHIITNRGRDFLGLALGVERERPYFRTVTPTTNEPRDDDKLFAAMQYPHSPEWVKMGLDKHMSNKLSLAKAGFEGLFARLEEPSNWRNVFQYHLRVEPS